VALGLLGKETQVVLLYFLALFSVAAVAVVQER
jgi:hypothetical protein